MDLDPSRKNNHKGRLEGPPISFYFEDSDDEASKANWETMSDSETTMHTYYEKKQQTMKEIDSAGANDSVKSLSSLLNSMSSKDDYFWKAFNSQLQDLLMFDEAKESLETRISDSNYLRTTLLHLVCKNDPPTQIVKTLIDACPRIATVLNESDMLPLHVICKYQASEEAIRIIYNACPSAINIRDKIGRIPLHYLFDPTMMLSWNGSEKNTSPGMKYLIPSPSLVKIIAGSSELASTADNDDTTPLCIFVSNCRKIRRTDQVGHDSALEIMRSLLDLSPLATNTLLIGISSLPKWLFEEVILHPHISCIVNAKSAEPKFLAMLMMDLIIQVILIVCFAVITTRNLVSDDRAVLNEPIVVRVLFIMSISFLVFRESVKLLGMSKFGIFSAWAWDMWNWFNVLNIFLVLLSGFVMIGSDANISSPSHKILIMIAGGMQWFVLLTVLRTAFLPFSVFVRGVNLIVFKLIPFFIVTILLLGSFTFMFFTAFSDSEGCSSDVNDDICSVKVVAEMIFGEFVGGGGDDDNGESDSIMPVLTYVFSFVVTILYFNVLIAVVTDTYTGVESSGEVVFWRNRFVYVLQLEARKNMLCGKDDSGSSHTSKFMNKARDKWEQLIWDLTSPATSFTFSGKINDLCNRIFMFTYVFLWVLIGVMTLGLPFPPQVREWIVCVQSKRAISEKDQIEELGSELQNNFNNGMKDLIEKINSNKEELDMNVGALDGRMYKMKMEMKMEFDEVKQLLTKLVNKVPAT